MRVHEVSTYYTQPLAGAYLTDFAKVNQFFEYNPMEQQDFTNRCNYLLEKPKDHLKTLADHLKTYNGMLGCGPETIGNIDLLAQGQALTVVTGQQPGIFTGPLYTVYKAIGAIKLARELTESLNRPVIPVFWIGADDHDFEEINHIYIPTADGPTKINITEKPAGRFSLGHTPVPQEIDILLKQLEELTPPIGWQQEGLELLRESINTSTNMADWFGRLMTFLFSEYGLVLVNPVLQPLRELSARIFNQAITTAPQVDHLLELSSAEVTGAGFTPQVSREMGKSHVFMYVQGQRQALFFRDNVFCNREGTVTLERDKIVELSLTNPELFSPDVILRPVVQEELFPVLTYVAGPGEISYFALLKKIFRHFGHKMPIIYPRPNITLVEPLVEKLLLKYQVPIEHIPGGLDNYISTYLEQSDNVGIEKLFNNFRQVIAEEQRKIVKEVSNLDPELKGLGKENLKRLMRGIASFEDKVNQRHRKNNQVAIRQLNKANHMIQPLGQWQERVYNIFPYLIKYHPQILKQILETLNVSDWRQKIIFFK